MIEGEAVGARSSNIDQFCNLIPEYFHKPLNIDVGVAGGEISVRVVVCENEIENFKGGGGRVGLTGVYES